MRQNGLIGRQVAGRFTIKRFLGEGGMATVYVAEQAAEPHQVALKIMNEDLNADRTFVKRFQREAKAAARVQHPNSVQIIDYGVAERISYIAMELLDGDDLYVLLEREGAIAQGRAARILVEVCDALMVAHELGIVHRDLKPENIMVIADGAHPNGERVKVLDFGIAKLLAPDSTTVDPRIDPASAVTRAGTFIGTPAYMSPEQCALLPVDTRADIYTCGVLLFQLVTGRLPFEGQTPLHTATLHIHEQAPRPSSFAPGIDQRLEAIIMKALAKKPTDRHQTARHLAATLRKILPDLPDVAVGKVSKAKPGSLRPAPTRAKAPPVAGAPAVSGHPGNVMESAKTMVAQGSGGPPPRAVLRRDAAPSSDDLVDSARAGIRRAPPAEDDDSEDDSMRTLVRAPVSELEEAPRFGPKHTEVMTPVLTPPAAKPQAPIKPVLSAPKPGVAAPAPVRPAPAPAASLTPAPASPPGPARIPKPTLLPAAERGLPEDEPVSVAPVSAEDADAFDVDTSEPAPVEPAVGRASVPDGRVSAVPAARASAVPAAPMPERTAVVSSAAYAETAKLEAPEGIVLVTASHGGAVSGMAETVPAISPAMVASVVASARASSGSGAPAAVPPPPLLPQTPPIYPLAPAAPEAKGMARISGTGGLLIGFFAGALIMALAAVVYLFMR